MRVSRTRDLTLTAPDDLTLTAPDELAVALRGRLRRQCVNVSMIVMVVSLFG